MAKQKNKANENRFRSRSEHILDAKGRLNIPSRFQEVLRIKYTELLVVTNWHRCLKAYPQLVWEDIENTLINQAKTHKGMETFVRYVISGVTECQLDKQGRILLPATLRTDLGIKKTVMLNGMLDHFEVWNKADWVTEAKKTRDNFDNFDLSTLGIL